MLAWSWQARMILRITMSIRLRQSYQGVLWGDFLGFYACLDAGFHGEFVITLSTTTCLNTHITLLYLIIVLTLLCRMEYQVTPGDRRRWNVTSVFRQFNSRTMIIIPPHRDINVTQTRRKRYRNEFFHIHAEQKSAPEGAGMPGVAARTVWSSFYLQALNCGK